MYSNFEDFTLIVIIKPHIRSKLSYFICFFYINVSALRPLSRMTKRRGSREDMPRSQIGLKQQTIRGHETQSVHCVIESRELCWLTCEASTQWQILAINYFSLSPLPR
ncbi:unnamed protein product [Nezara viridula]|uniref:Uncharacterized protein n=1 Tax=Nezara viridula TaxID=85310 RepID=A0A9P0MUU3_NEZVI|nr:unnamed protein product [Nezara viridula]